MKPCLENITHGYVVLVSALILALLLPGQTALGSIFSCPTADGSVTFQDTPCAVSKKPEKAKKKKLARVPFGIHESWFEKPQIVPDDAYCSEKGCQCDAFARDFDSGLALAIADALYLDGSWHRLSGKLIEYNNHVGSSVEKQHVKMDVNEAACNILMSQKILKLFAEDVLKELKRDKRYAENRGWDTYEDCLDGNTTACEYADKTALFDRIQTDIKNLHSSRFNNSYQDSYHLLPATDRTSADWIE